MRVAAVQLDVMEGSKDRALDHAIPIIRSCRGADLVILPELWNVGFMSFDKYRDSAETVDGPTVSALKDLARDLSSYIHTGSIVEEDRGVYYNTSFLIDRTGVVVGSYRKMHLFTFESDEAQILTAGDSVTVISTDLGQFGLATCYDLRFPEMFRAMVDRGAECFLVTAAWPYPRIEPWLLFARVRALENLSYLVSANCSGLNRGRQFVGHSQIVDPWGHILAGAGDGESVVSAEIEPDHVRDVRRSFPALDERRFTCRLVTGPDLSDRAKRKEGEP